MSLTIDIHAIQTLPPSLINRDDTGAPKTAIFGGVPRQRVSSQAWKKAVRTDFNDRFPAEQLGVRTRRVGKLICDRIQDLTEDAGAKWDTDRCIDGVRNLFSAAKIKLQEPKESSAKDSDGEEAEGKEAVYPEVGYLLFLGNHQIDRAARKIIEHDGEKFKKSEAEEVLDKEHAIDVAMFGRMVADAPAFNVDASVQVAHAIGIHESQPEFDYFTAVDDAVVQDQETGAGMIGTVQMMSSTLYRFATVDFESLTANLQSEETALKATAAFIDSFVTSLPTGKQNTFAHNTLPELVYVTVSDTRSISLVNAFEVPVKEDGSGRRQNAAKALAAEAAAVRDSYGFEPTGSFVLALGDNGDEFEDFAERVSLKELGDRVTAAIKSQRSE